MNTYKLKNCAIVTIIAFTLTSLLACGGSDDMLTEEDPNKEVSDIPSGDTRMEIENRHLLNYWQNNGTKVPCFRLFSDGTCSLTDSKSSDGDGLWSYDTQTKVLAITGHNNYAFTVKLLTSDMLSAEWSSASGTRTDTWNARVDPYSLDPAWGYLILGRWENEIGENIVFKDRRFIMSLKSASATIKFSGKYTFLNNVIQLETDDVINYINREGSTVHGKLIFYITGLTASFLYIPSDVANSKYAIVSRIDGIDNMRTHLSSFRFME